MKKGIEAYGLYVENGIFFYDDAGKSIKSYLDTGVFILLAGSQTVCNEEKLKNCMQYCKFGNRKLACGSVQVCP